MVEEGTVEEQSGGLARRTRSPSIGVWVAAAIAGVLLAVVVTGGTAIWALEAVDDAADDAIAESSGEAIPLLRTADDVNTSSVLLGAMAQLPNAPEGLAAELAASIVTVDQDIRDLARADTEEGAKIDEGTREWETARPTLEAAAASGEASADDPQVIDAFTHLLPAGSEFRAAHEIAMNDVAAELATVDERRERAVLTMVIVGIATLLLGALIARVLSRNLVRPIRQLRRAAFRVAAGDLEGPIANGGPRELAELSDAFDTMTADLRRREAELVYHAYHDPLTGLGNRALLRERLDHALAQLSRRADERLALCMIDLDSFKKVNDSLGHPSGDEAIVLTSERIASCLREGDTLARLGGDEFAVLAENIGDGAFELATRICHSLREPFDLVGREIVLSASVGIALAVLGTESPVELLRDADLAMYDAKEQGGDGVSFFDPHLFEHATARIEQESALRQALDRGELRIHYQPTIDLRNRRFEGAEALVRWQHPERGLLPPGAFLPLAEEVGLDVPLGWYVLRTALADARGWIERNPELEPFTISVNVSAGQLGTRDFVTRIHDALAESGLAARHLALEVTETAILLDQESVREKLAAVRTMGVRVALDDFGTGYSSLQHLQHYPVDIVKIDRSFVSDLTHRADLTTLVRAILELGRAYGIAVVAEGVEAADVAAALTDLGCPAGQGYWFAHPAPAETTERFLSPAAEGVDAAARVTNT